MNIVQSLHHYLEALEKRGFTTALHSGVDRNEIRVFENEIGIAFPDAFVEIYRAFNGQIHELIPPEQPRWLALEEILGKQQEWQEFCRCFYGKDWQSLSFSSFDGQGLVKNTFYNPLWIPFMVDNEGFFCLDFDPNKNGQAGQIIYVKLLPDHKESCLYYLCDHFALWFENHAQAFQLTCQGLSLAKRLDNYLIGQMIDPFLMLNPPLSEKYITEQEDFLDFPFPNLLKKVWQAFNGYAQSVPFQGRWLPIEEIMPTQKAWHDSIIARFGVDPETTERPDADQSPHVRRYYWSTHWLPFFTQDYLIVAIDYDPMGTQGGVMGQILVISNNDSYEILALFESFDEWLYSFLTSQEEMMIPMEMELTALPENLPQLLQNHYQQYFNQLLRQYHYPSDHTKIDFFVFKKEQEKEEENNTPSNFQAMISCGLSNYPFSIANKDHLAMELAILLPEDDEINVCHWAFSAFIDVIRALLAEKVDCESGVMLFEAPRPFLKSPFSGFMILPPVYSFHEDFYKFYYQQNRVDVFILIPLFKEEIDMLKMIKSDAFLIHFYRHFNHEISDFRRKNLAHFLEDYLHHYSKTEE